MGVKTKMKCNLIFEGADCVGKTTTISDFIKYTKGWKEVKKFSAPKFDRPWKTKRAYFDYMKTLNKKTGSILDRGFLGEEIYGPLKRGYEVGWMRDLEKTSAKHNVIVILYSSNPKLIAERFDGDFITIEEQLQINAFYIMIARKLKYEHVIVIDVAKAESDERVVKIKKYLKRNGLL